MTEMTGQRIRRARLRADWLVALLVVLAVQTAGPIARAQEPSTVDQVVRMLAGDLDEEIIVEWLEQQTAPWPPLTADQLLALKEAGASDELMRQLLARAANAGTEPGPEAPPASAPPAPAVVPSTYAAPPLGGLAAEAPSAPVTVRLSYLPQSDVSEGGVDEAWDLFVYVDGIPVSYLPPPSLQHRPETLEFARAVAAGDHVVRVFQERHRKQGGRWRHETRVAPSQFAFSLAAATPALLEVEFQERLMDYQDPLAFKLLQGATVLDTGRVGGEAEAWPALCDDLEASVPEGKEPNRRQRQKLETCVEWESLWSERQVPPRRDVLQAMAEFDYRPRPKGS